MRVITLKEATAREGDITTKVWYNTPGKKPLARPEHVWRVLDEADRPLTAEEIVHALYGVTVLPDHDGEWNRTRTQLCRLRAQGIIESRFSGEGRALYWIKGRF